MVCQLRAECRRVTRKGPVRSPAAFPDHAHPRVDGLAVARGVVVEDVGPVHAADWTVRLACGAGADRRPIEKVPPAVNRHQPRIEAEHSMRDLRGLVHGRERRRDECHTGLLQDRRQVAPLRSEAVQEGRRHERPREGTEVMLIEQSLVEVEVCSHLALRSHRPVFVVPLGSRGNPIGPVLVADAVQDQVKVVAAIADDLCRFVQVWALPSGIVPVASHPRGRR